MDAAILLCSASSYINERIIFLRLIQFSFARLVLLTSSMIPSPSLLEPHPLQERS